MAWEAARRRPCRVGARLTRRSPANSCRPWLRSRDGTAVEYCSHHARSEQNNKDRIYYVVTKSLDVYDKHAQTIVAKMFFCSVSTKTINKKVVLRKRLNAGLYFGSLGVF